MKDPDNYKLQRARPQKGDLILHTPSGKISELVALHDFRGSLTVEIEADKDGNRQFYHDGWNCELVQCNPS